MIKTTPAKLSYSQTLVSLYSGCFLTHEDFDILIKNDCSDDVNLVLSKAGLSHIISESNTIDVCSYNSEKLESLFLSEFINQSINVVRSFSGTEHDLLFYWLRQIEICNIKTILRGKAMHRSNQAIEAELFDLGPYTTLPIDALIQTEDVAEVLRCLDNTFYASLAFYTLKQYEQHNQIFSLETSVDQQFFIGLVRRLNMLQSNDKSQLHPLLGRIIDQMNLVRLLRYRINYKLSPSHTYFLLSSGGYRLKQQDLLNLVKLKKIDNLLTELPATLATRLHSLLDGKQQSIQSINSVMESEVIDFAQYFLRVESFCLTSVFAFLIIRRYQLSLVHAILKGKAMNVNEQLIRFAIGLH
ncbi:MAG: V-type ATPase subunit [Gammaproteobacteria bacterium]|nr:V-type ATPase subunit [Gammaproteobacteria bacterium]